MTGVAFPRDAKGKRTTTRAGKEVWAAAALALESLEGRALAQDILLEKDWRHRYPKHLTALAELQSTVERAMCVASARAGLAALHDHFEFVVEEGEDDETSRPLADAMREAVTDGRTYLRTARIGRVAVSRSPPPAASEALLASARAWAADGAIERDVVDALERANAHATEWASERGLFKDVVFVLLGGTSELCPLIPLLERGATVACVARGEAGIKSAAAIATASECGGTLLFPIKPKPWEADLRFDESKAVSWREAWDEGRAGADLIADAPALAAWLCALEPKKRLVIGSYAYLDGEAHVRASLASDAVAAAVLDKRPDTALAYLTSPGTAFPIPKSAWDDSKARHERENWTWWHQPLWLFTGGFKPNCRPPAKREKKLRVIDEDAEVDDASAEMHEDVHVHDGHLVLQGPNYALAKTLQNWRAIVARDDGHCVSANVAPASRTKARSPHAGPRTTASAW